MDHVLSTRSARAAGRPGALRRLLILIAERRSRRRLAELDDHLLRDLGLTAGEARQAAKQVDWNAPAHWLR